MDITEQQLTDAYNFSSQVFENLIIPAADVNNLESLDELDTKEAWAHDVFMMVLKVACADAITLKDDNVWEVVTEEKINKQKEIISEIEQSLKHVPQELVNNFTQVNSSTNVVNTLDALGHRELAKLALDKLEL